MSKRGRTKTGLWVNDSFSSALSTESDDGDSTGNVKSLSQPVHTPRRWQCRPLPASCSITLNTILSRPGLSNGELETSHTNLITFPIPRHPCSTLPYGILCPKIVHYRNVIIVVFPSSAFRQYIGWECGYIFYPTKQCVQNIIIFFF